MEAITEFVGTMNGIVWGIPMLILILGAGLFLPRCRPKPLAKAVIVLLSPACYSLAVDDD